MHSRRHVLPKRSDNESPLAPAPAFATAALAWQQPLCQVPCGKCCPVMMRYRYVSPPGIASRNLLHGPFRRRVPGHVVTEDSAGTQTDSRLQRTARPYGDSEKAIEIEQYDRYGNKAVP